MSVNGKHGNHKNLQADLISPALSHLDSNGDISMVDVSDKKPTTREAHASGQVRFPDDIYTQIKAADGMTKKGSITQTAHIAGITNERDPAGLSCPAGYKVKCSRYDCR